MVLFDSPLTVSYAVLSKTSALLHESASTVCDVEGVRTVLYRA